LKDFSDDLNFGKKNAEKKLKLDVAGGDFVIFLFSDDEHAPAKCPYIATERSSSE
jgi:hypothetical protein